MKESEQKDLEIFIDKIYGDLLSNHRALNNQKSFDKVSNYYREVYELNIKHYKIILDKALLEYDFKYKTSLRKELTGENIYENIIKRIAPETVLRKVKINTEQLTNHFNIYKPVVRGDFYIKDLKSELKNLLYVIEIAKSYDIDLNEFIENSILVESWDEDDDYYEIDLMQRLNNNLADESPRDLVIKSIEEYKRRRNDGII